MAHEERGIQSIADVVDYLLLLLHKNGIPLFLRYEYRWHILFYGLKKTQLIEGKPAFLRELVLDWDGIYPKCNELSEYLTGLRVTGTATIANIPRFSEDYVLREDVAMRWEEQFDLLSETDKKFLFDLFKIAKEQFIAIQ